MFGFLNATLSTSTQRFLNIEIGKGNVEKLREVFSNSLFLHIILVLIILLLAETIGLWYVKNMIVMPAGRENAAFWVYQFSVIAACIQIIQLPFMATIIAHEKMNAYAYISIYEGVAKLLIVYLIQVLDYDKLIMYGLFILIVQISVATFYNIYCQRHFKEARFRVKANKSVLKNMVNFSGWNIIGNVGYVCNSQGINMIMNLFFGTVMNAARGISFQVHSLVTQFVNNFQIAVKPQVIKYYASGQFEEMVKLVFNAAKYSAFLMIFMTTPIILEIDTFLHLWLGEFPQYTIIFTQLILFRSIITSMTGNIVMVVHASGYLKKVAISSGVALLLVLPVSYVLLKLGLPPYIPFIVNIVAAVLDAFFELYWMRRYINFPMGRFYKEVYAPVFLLLIPIFLLSYSVHYIMSDYNEFIRLIVVGISCLLISGFFIYRFGFDESMRNKIKGTILVKLKIKS